MDSSRKALWSLLVLTACVAAEVPRRLWWGQAAAGTEADAPWR